MAQWQRNLRLQPEWTQAQNGKITSHQMAAVVAKRLKALRPFADSGIEATREELVEMFDEIAEHEDVETDEFDSCMERLYDWGDTPLDDHWNGKKACWINTFQFTLPI